MQNFSIREKCTVNTNWEEDTFVGFMCENGKFSVHFPLGFRMVDTDKELRKDIIMLLNTIGMTTGKRDSKLQQTSKVYNEVAFPFQSYLYVIKDYFERGYYKERESRYVVSKRGKIDWNRTIKTQEAYVQDGNVFYLDFVTKKNSLNEDELISLIHEYCVYDSFSKVGWLFTDQLPKQPRIKFKYKLFYSVLRQKIAGTFNDKNKRLFMEMLAIVEYKAGRSDSSNYKYGTYRFEYVWEMLIDKVYGIVAKERYFPSTSWIINGVSYSNACLEPDTIMICNGNIYVLDAKYYKYGATRRVSDLPESTSINKQITYGEYIAEQEDFKKIHGNDYKVYNAFLMPYAAKEDETIENIGLAISNWKSNVNSYEKIQGILLDVKHLMRLGISQNETEIAKLALEIEKAMEG